MEQLEKKLQPASSDASLYEQARQALNRHTYAQRLRFVVLAGELKGPAEACEQLHLLNDIWRENHLAPPEDEAETAACSPASTPLGKKISAADPLPEKDRQVLRDRLGWFGDLALTPAEGSDPAARRRCWPRPGGRCGPTFSG